MPFDVITNILGYNNNKDTKSFAVTNKANLKDVKSVETLTQEKRIIDKTNFLEALNKYINERNLDKREKYSFNVEKIKKYLEESKLNDNALIDNDTKQFIEIETMIVTTKDESLYRKSIIQMAIQFLPERSYELVSSFVNKEANEMMNVGDEIILYNYDDSEFKEISGNIITDIVLINTKEVSKNELFGKCENIILGPLVESIGSFALSRSSISSIVIGNSVTSIGGYALSNCQKLESIIIPNSVTSIGDHVFYGSEYLTSVIISGSVKRIKLGAFEKCKKLTSIVIPDSVEYIENNAFSECASMESIQLSKSLTRIEMGVFERCVKLTSIIIPDSVTRIGESAFMFCLKLKSVLIPSSVTIIDSQAFDECTSLKSIVINNLKEDMTISPSAFSDETKIFYKK